MKRLARITILACASLLLACSDEGLTPEQEIRQFIASGVEAAENRSADDLDDLMHRDYFDRRGYNKKQLGKLLRLYFFQHKNIYLLTRIGEIELLADNKARVDLHVAMAGSSIADVSALASLRARMYRFELHLIKQEEWRLQNASWYLASIADMQ